MDYVESVVHTLDELKKQFLVKNKQYATADPLATFRRGALMACGKADYETMFEEAKAYERKHLAHIMSKDINANKIDESLKDIIIYSAIELYLYQKHQEQRGTARD